MLTSREDWIYLQEPAKPDGPHEPAPTEGDGTESEDDSLQPAIPQGLADEQRSD